jgi:hypothetical protein
MKIMLESLKMRIIHIWELGFELAHDNGIN